MSGLTKMPKKGDRVEVTWWDHTYSIDEQSEPAQLVTIWRYLKTATKSKKKYIVLYGEWERDQAKYEYLRHHYTIMLDDVIAIETWG